MGKHQILEDSARKTVEQNTSPDSVSDIFAYKRSLRAKILLSRSLKKSLNLNPRFQNTYKNKEYLVRFKGAICETKQYLLIIIYGWISNLFRKSCRHRTFNKFNPQLAKLL